MLNIFLDILFVAGFNMGIKGAAAATVIAQYISGIGIFIYMIAAFYPEYRIHKSVPPLTGNPVALLAKPGYSFVQRE